MASRALFFGFSTLFLYVVRQRHRRAHSLVNLLSREEKCIVQAVHKACLVCETVRKSKDKSSLKKEDHSPVTIADFASQAIINMAIQSAYPSDRIVGEEDSQELRADPDLLSRVAGLVCDVCDVDKDQILHAIDIGALEAGDFSRYWAVDPIDGTKGFLRGDQYAVAVGLVENGKARFGILGCPNLPTQSHSRGCIIVGSHLFGSFSIPLDANLEKAVRISVSNVSDPSEAWFVESLESSHSDHDASARIASILGISKKPVRMDSQCKYTAVARGDAPLYMRLPMGRHQAVWDHAAGVAIVEASGGQTSDMDGIELDFGAGRYLVRNRGVFVSNRKLHSAIVNAAKSISSS